MTVFLYKARKLKRIGQLKSQEDPPMHSPIDAIQCFSPKCSLNFPTQVAFLNVLEAIEPVVVNSGHDHAQPDSAACLLTSLNELGERQLVKVVKWAKGLPGKAHGNVYIRDIKLSPLWVLYLQILAQAFEITFKIVS